MVNDLPRARCWLEVNTKAVINNYELAAGMMQHPDNLIAVLKADAYGLGLCQIGRLLWDNGCRKYAVACLDEAFKLRAVLPDAFILCMGETLDGNLTDAVCQEIRLTVGSEDAASRISAAAVRIKKTAFVHFKVDTGLHRIGFNVSDAAEKIAACTQKEGIEAEGLYTHLALRDHGGDENQNAGLMTVFATLKEQGIDIPMLHMIDTIGLCRYAKWEYDGARVGAMLYGNYPKGFDQPEKVMPVVRFVARVTRVFTIKAGECVGYDDEHPLDHDAVIASVSAGYADGYPRVFSNKGEVIIHGKRAKIVGLICMDQMMTDITDIEGVKPGDEVVMLGGEMNLREYAEVGHLNRNECTSIITGRVPRIYI